jgi:hypothetical protein
MKILLLLSVCSLLCLSIGCQASSKKEAYELRERCGKSASQWAKTKSGEVINYTAHYNGNLNKCFILAELSPAVSNNFYSSFTMLYDVDENKEYGHLTTRTYDNGNPESHQCIINGKYYTDKDQAHDKWKTFLKSTMEE